MESASGPLHGTRIVEFAGIGPGPFCAMLLADMGAEIISVDRVVAHGLGIRKKARRFDPVHRNRPSMALELKSAQGREVALRLLAQSDALIEGFRPGVMERLGLSPEACWQRNPKLVYGRMTGWGQEGPLAQAVGHDLNYLALSGVLPFFGARDRPPAFPLNLLGDFSGAVYLALGIVAAILESKSSGKGQVVDAAMLDGISSLMTNQFGYAGSGDWVPERESNVIDGGAPWYRVYETSDGKHVSVAAAETKFYRELVKGMGLDPDTLPDQYDRSSWPGLRERFAQIFAGKTRDAWSALMEGREACFAPVLDIAEAQKHPHALSRNSFIEVEGVMQPAPAPRFSRTPSTVRRPVPAVPGANTDEVMARWGFSESEITELKRQNIVTQA